MTLGHLHWRHQLCCVKVRFYLFTKRKMRKWKFDAYREINKWMKHNCALLAKVNRITIFNKQFDRFSLWVASVLDMPGSYERVNINHKRQISLHISFISFISHCALCACMYVCVHGRTYQWYLAEMPWTFWARYSPGIRKYRCPWPAGILRAESIHANPSIQLPAENVIIV